MTSAIILPQGSNDDFPLQLEVEAGSARDTAPVMVGFGLYPMLDEHESAKAGHEIWRDVEHVKIAIPGDRNTLFFQPASDKHKARFPQAYARFKSNGAIAGDVGTPLSQWPLITRASMMTLGAVHVRTVEALAAVNDDMLGKLGHEVRGLREKARVWINERKDASAAAKMAQEKADLEDRLVAMQAQMDTLLKAQAADDASVPAAVAKARKRA